MMCGKPNAFRVHNKRLQVKKQWPCKESCFWKVYWNVTSLVQEFVIRCPSFFTTAMSSFSFFCCFLHLICKFKKPSHVVALDESSKSLNCSRRLEQSITWHWWSINTFSSLANAQDSTRSFSRMIIRAWLRVAKRFSAKLSSLETHNFRVKGSPRIGS